MADILTCIAEKKTGATNNTDDVSIQFILLSRIIASMHNSRAPALVKLKKEIKQNKKKKEWDTQNEYSQRLLQVWPLMFYAAFVHFL